ncbi:MULTISPECIES: Stk1 family PASTA domain-containing Ser/Thr kinase [Streptomyces]|uniref:Stk1 family PASTA domain-containing Ser/Thr kinase n=1 Tax=Streptomyces TaxID=1883 RepID=UPI000F73A482|nr:MULTISPECIES: Stk1 family PASTA domain-containing Ser/Thr kinase [Streptomyces]QEV68936.1 serine/threonine protein kinase [Streptomyces chartreusis]RSN82770.1 serine/threonine protein kinase [Streptomyces sp. WAC 05379]GGX44523.1 serine/threonine-protein kinase PksC [Streptomyces chartreusis]
MSQDGAQGTGAGRALAGGRYQLRDLLGQGGMAAVHLAYDSVLDRQVAVKTLHTELGREQAFRERFRREAQAVAKLTHTNIVSVFDTGEDTVDGMTTPYIVMEYIEGRPLSSVFDEDVRQLGAVPADKALKITADVLAALEISHEMGLVHRDIKPGNVMLNKRGVVKVMDFGIARAMQSGVTSMTQTGMVVGTPQYLSPEQALGRAVDARSDLYSVGIMLFQLVTGRLPFDADSPLAIAYAHVQEEPVAPSSVNRALPPAVDALVARALKKNPNERFPSAEAMRDECLRVAASFQAAPPSIVPGANTQSGQGVGASVFPPVGQTPPPGGPVQTPYQPTPPPNPYGTPPPSAPSPAYGYPQQQPGFQTPAPAAYSPQPGMATPPPYSISPQTQTNSGGGKNNRPVIIGSIVVSIVAVVGLIAALALNGGGNEDDGGGGGDATATSSATKKAGYREGDSTKTVETSDCTEPSESYLDPDKVTMPDFTFKYWPSVLECVKAAGWDWEKVDVDENTYGQGTVMRQSPKLRTDFDPEDPPTITFQVSTGNPE